MLDSTTSIGGDARSFPATSWTLVFEAGEHAGVASRAALDRLVAAYWKPVYAHIRRRWRTSNEDAKDLTQEFFATLLERESIARCRGEGAPFRAFVRVALDNFLVDERRRARRLRRGGGRAPLPLDEAREPTAREVGDFDREWAAATVRAGLGALEEMYVASGRATWFETLRRIDLAVGARPTYAEVAQALGISVDDVHNFLRHARRSLREILVRQVRETLADGADVETEMAALFAGGGGR